MKAKDGECLGPPRCA